MWSVGGWCTNLTASQPLTSSGIYPASCRAREAQEGNPVCWCSHLGKTTCWAAASAAQKFPRRAELNFNFFFFIIPQKFTFLHLCFLRELKKFLLLQIHRCSGYRQGFAPPSWPSYPSRFHHWCCHCLCGATGFLLGAQVTFFLTSALFCNLLLYAATGAMFWIILRFWCYLEAILLKWCSFNFDYLSSAVFT